MLVTKETVITLIKAGKITIKIKAPITGLNKKLSENTLTWGAVLEIIPKIMSWAIVASKIGPAICKPINNMFPVTWLKYWILTKFSKWKSTLYIGNKSKLLTNALKSQYIPPE